MGDTSRLQQLKNLLEACELIDLSYVLEEGMPAWPTQARYDSTVYESYDYGGESFHRAVYMSEHTGTHIDAPVHFIKNGETVDKIDIRKLMGRGVTINADHVGECSLLTAEDIQTFEKENGPIVSGDIVMIRFGWDKKYGIYGRGLDFMKNWPGLSGEAAEYLKEKRISAVGCDTLSLDRYGVKTYICHEIFLGNNIPIIENIANLDKVPVYSYVIGFHNKLKGGSASPIRLAALVI